MRSLAQADAPVVLIDVVHPKLAKLRARRGVEQRHDADEGLVRMHVISSDPPSKEASLFDHRQGVSGQDSRSPAGVIGWGRPAGSWPCEPRRRTGAMRSSAAA